MRRFGVFAGLRFHHLFLLRSSHCVAGADKTLTCRLSGPLRGSARIAGGALEAQLGLVLAALSAGRSTLYGIDDRADIDATIAALRALGCHIESGDAGAWRVNGVGVGGLAEPDRVLAIGAAGLGIPLLIAATAMQPMTAILDGGDAEAGRTWHWLTGALETSGAGFVARPGAPLPITVLGAESPMPGEFNAGTATERAALLLAGLHCPGETVVRQRFPDNDGTDATFKAFGARLTRSEAGAEIVETRISGQTELWPATLTLDSDSATAVAIAIAALSVPGSEVVLEGVRLDARVAQVKEWLQAFGADIAGVATTVRDGSMIVDYRLRAGPLTATWISPDETTVSIDDFPLLAVVAARAHGRTTLAGWERHPEWLAQLERGFRRCGVDARAEGMSLVIAGSGGAPIAGGYVIEEALDHRVAAAFLLLGLSTEAPVALDHGSALLEHFPSLIAMLARLDGVPTLTDP
jgi:3-phosphoshikimate 1-carboxyvinyltransferase